MLSELLLLAELCFLLIVTFITATPVPSSSPPSSLPGCLTEEQCANLSGGPIGGAVAIYIIMAVSNANRVRPRNANRIPRRNQKNDCGRPNQVVWL